MKVLFLDIDGVLNSVRTSVAFGGYPMELEHIAAFDAAAIRLLQRLCDSAGVQVVLSSAWRKSYTAAQVGKALGLPIIDSTPSHTDGHRGGEIKAWLDAHPEVKAYAIIDDDSDMLGEQLPFFVHTDCHEGMTWADFVKLCGLFGESAYAGAPRSRNWQQGGVVLDPFMGSGSTGKAAMLEGFRFIGCELSPEYLAIARARIEHAHLQAEATRGSDAPSGPSQPDLFAA